MSFGVPVIVRTRAFRSTANSTAGVGKTILAYFISLYQIVML
jgi:hypothetical protein